MEWNRIQGRDLAESPPRASGASGMRLFEKIPVRKVFRGTGSCVTGRPPDLEGKNKVMSGQDSLIERSPVRSRPGQVPAGARGLDGRRDREGEGVGGMRQPGADLAHFRPRARPMMRSVIHRRSRDGAGRSRPGPRIGPQSLQPTRPSASRKGYQLCYGPDPCWWPSPSRRVWWGALNATRVMTSRRPASVRCATAAAQSRSIPPLRFTPRHSSPRLTRCAWVRVRRR
jgi:hypothetical protein